MDQRPRNLSQESPLFVILDAEIYRESVGAEEIIQTLVDSDQIETPLTIYVSHGGFEARWKECPCYPPFSDFVAEELFPWIEARFQGMTRANRRVIAGLSYTGLAASYIALRREKLFTHVVSQSGSYWSEDEKLTGDVSELTLEHKPAFLLDVGDQETAANVLHREDIFQKITQIRGVENFRDALVANGYTIEYHQFEGGHDASGWSSSLPNALKWALFRESASAR